MGDTEDILSIVLVIGGIWYGFKSGLFDKIADEIKNIKLPDIQAGGNNTGSTGGNKNTGGSVGSGQAISFSAFGDIGSGRNSNWKKLVELMKTKGSKVVVVPGDFSYTNASDFKPVADAVKAFAKFFGAEGNHDGGGFAALFDSFSNSVATVGDTSFMMLNSESGGSAVTFAKGNLSKMTGKWKVVVFHKPIYTVKSDHSADEAGMKSLVPEFEKAGVNLVLQAHNHNYQRFQPVNGVTYIVTGLGGEGDIYSLGSACSGCPAVAKTYGGGFGFSHFTTGNTMSGQFIGANGQVIDSFTISPKTASVVFAEAKSTYRVLI